MSLGRLILTPVGLENGLDQRELVLEHLKSIGFLGDAMPEVDEHAYQGGPEFLAMMCFLGCSPHVILQQMEDGVDESEMGCGSDLVHIRVPEVSDHPQFLANPQTRPVRCPECDAADRNWRDQISIGPQSEASPQWTCPSCGHDHAVSDLNWRNNAGAFRFSVEVWRVFPKEALPNNNLLNALKDVSGCEWSYFYAVDD